MATLFLVRHGQASFGAADYDRLSDLGRQQARWLGEYFAGRELRFKRVLCGHLSRQLETAREVLAGMGDPAAPIGTHAGLNEYDAEALYAAYSGGADQRAHQNADYSHYWRTFRAAQEAWSGGGLPDLQESWTDFGARIRAGLDQACGDTVREDAILVVTSGGVIGHTVADLVGAPARSAIELNMQVRNAAFCEIIVGSRATRLVSFNSIPHLDAPGRRHALTSA